MTIVKHSPSLQVQFHCNETSNFPYVAETLYSTERIIEKNQHFESILSDISMQNCDVIINYMNIWSESHSYVICLVKHWSWLIL